MRRIPWGFLVFAGLYIGWVSYKSKRDSRLSKIDAACRNGNGWLRSDLPKDALKHFDEALALDPNCFDALLGRGRALRSLEDWSGAIAAFEDASRARSTDHQPWQGLGGLYRKMGLPEKAAEAYLEASKRKPGDEELQLALAYAYLESKAWKAAASILRTYLEKVPLNASARYHLGCALVELGKHEEAREIADHLAANNASELSEKLFARLKRR